MTVLTWQDLERIRVASGITVYCVSWVCDHSKTAGQNFGLHQVQHWSPTSKKRDRRTRKCVDCYVPIKHTSTRCAPCGNRARGKVRRTAA